MKNYAESVSQTEDDAEIKSRPEEDAEDRIRIEEDAEGKNLPNVPEVDEVQCSGRLCNRYGLSFSTYILNHFSVDKLVIEDVMRECHYVDGRDSDDLSDREKRFCLYYWYSENVYMVCGKHNRCQLPDCLIGKIRNTYPNTDGSA